MGELETLGIVGGGQLGRMLALSAFPLGFKVVVINPEANGPAKQVGAEEIVADLYDPAAINELAKKSDYLTVEIEHLDTEALSILARGGKHINPAPSTIKLIQDKFKQTEFLHNAGVPVAPFTEIHDTQSAVKALKDFGGKMLVKARHGAYDGRGNMLVKDPSEVAEALAKFDGRQLYAESYVPFEKEIAVMVARDDDGNVSMYPVVETIHERNICIEVHAPAPVDEAAHKRAEEVALSVAKLLEGAGMFCIEMFLTAEGEVLVNEIAPRVHNSGHLTIEANRTSQFEQHIRAVTGLPLGDTSMVVPAAVMVNILGDRDGATRLTGLSRALKIPGVSVHLYGKSPTKIDRKMGHITATGVTLKEARERAEQARQLISI